MDTSKQSELGTLMHLVKSCVGTGILSMPLAFKSAGLLVGTLGLIFAALICTHCVYILVAIAQELRKKSGKLTLTYPDVAEETFKNGPTRIQKYDWRLVDVGIFIAYFTVCSAYTVIIANNFDKFTSIHWGPINIRVYIAMLLIPLILLCYIPNWKYLTPISTLSNICMAVGVGITIYYLVQDLPSPATRELIADVSTFPTFFGISIFSLQAIGAAMPLENCMKKPKKFLGTFGILNRGLSIVALTYITVGFLGYLRFGESTNDNITLNLPNKDYAAQAVQILIGVSVFGTFGVQFFICLDIIWSSIGHHYKRRPQLANYILRTIMVVIAVAIAVAVPTIGPFISFIGAFCFSTIGIIIPIILEMVVLWNKGFGKYNWIFIKDIVILVAGVSAFVFGTATAIQDIVKLYED